MPNKVTQRPNNRLALLPRYTRRDANVVFHILFAENCIKIKKKLDREEGHQYRYTNTGHLENPVCGYENLRKMHFNVRSEAMKPMPE